ncbi:MAG TPA: CaiB/BaiF CoA-transferase family protein, partial [Beijerinckiaceae bacterium]|nr:CaiB/BaiF CoA-transferase family protein [Beijerinckiaceae bacterium]
LGNAHPNIVPYQDLPTKDGALIVAVGNDAQFASFCRALGRADWAQDPRFASNGARVAHRDELTPLLEKATKERNTSDWISALEAAGVPCGRVNTIAEVFADPQVQARKLRIDMPHPLAGSTPSVRNPIRLSESPISYRLSPPTLGEHTDEVLTSLLGLASGEFESLRAQGIV